MGTATAYVGLAGWFRSNALNGGLSALANAPWRNLFIIVIAMPVAAGAIGWLLAGREPRGVATRPME
jgi:putative ABC transport system permease protein